MKFKTRTRKLAALLATVLVFSCIFAGCGKEEEQPVASVDSIETEEPEEEKEEEKYKKPEGSITVATFNIAHGRECDNYYPTLAQDIVDSGAEIVGIQEIDQMTGRNQSQNTLKILSQKTGMEYTAFAPALTPYDGGEYGIGVLSKYPIQSFEYHQLPKLSDAEEQRVILHAKIDVNGFILDFFVTHGQQSSITQQLKAANEYIKQCNTFIYTGDFNTNNYGLYKNIENSRPIVNADYPIPTSDSHSFDNIILSNDIDYDMKNIRTIDTGHSDHYMLLVDVMLPKK